MEQITENPYLQYFIGLPGYQDTPPFDAGTLVLFRKRIRLDMLIEANEYTDRIEVERFFSRNKRCYGLGCIVTKLEETHLTSIALSVFVSNLVRIQKRILLRLFWQYFQYVIHIGGYSLKMV